MVVTRRFTHSALLTSFEFPSSPWSRCPNYQEASHFSKDGLLRVKGRILGSGVFVVAATADVCGLWPANSTLTAYTQSPATAQATAVPRPAFPSAAGYASFWHTEPCLDYTCRPWLCIFELDDTRVLSGALSCSVLKSCKRIIDSTLDC